MKGERPVLGRENCVPPSCSATRGIADGDARSAGRATAGSTIPFVGGTTRAGIEVVATAGEFWEAVRVGAVGLIAESSSAP